MNLPKDGYNSDSARRSRRLKNRSANHSFHRKRFKIETQNGSPLEEKYETAGPTEQRMNQQFNHTSTTFKHDRMETSGECFIMAEYHERYKGETALSFDD